ncbi:MAG TPA: efflux RND transporter periplasmic adaptor subunit [Acidobacteriota bacterium]|nr:efflux RND transporter periplasmic adaptor subunit [Acidobacteriota bacterium]
MNFSKSWTFCLLLLSGCATSQQAAGPPAPPPPSVTVTTVTRAAVSDSTEYVGRTEPVEIVELRARVTGFLTRRVFEEGSDVKEGDLLYVIEQEPYRAAVEMAEAAVAQTEAALENAQKFLERLNSVSEKGGASKASLDAARSNVLEATALLKERRARLTQARLDLSYTEIRAPISGRIGRTSVHVGNLVGPETGVLATIVKLDPIWVSFPISERDYLRLQEKVAAGRKGGLTIPELVPTIRLVDGALFPHKGRIDFQDNQVDRGTGTIMLRATFPNPRLLLRPGQFVTVIQTERRSTDRLLVPQAAVQNDQVGPYVFVVDEEQKAQIRRIEVGGEYGTDLIVMNGLTEGDRVISGGIQKVIPGNKVNPVAALPDEQGGTGVAQ